MTKISKEEYEILKGLGDRWRWIARDSKGDDDGNLFARSERPIKFHDQRCWFYGGWHRPIDNHLFQFIQWEDEEPYNIQELIEEYEDESEVKEAKSKKDLIEKWESAIEAADFYGKGKEGRLIGYMKDFVSDLNQLDEPEVLTQEWISEHSNGPSRSQYVWVSDLKELLVPELSSTREETQNDPVHKPKHYMQGHIETIDKIKLLLTPEEYLGYLKGNVIKYDRAPFKGNMEQDYDKQKVYYDWALEQMEEMQNEE